MATKKITYLNQQYYTRGNEIIRENENEVSVIACCDNAPKALALMLNAWRMASMRAGTTEKALQLIKEAESLPGFSRARNQAR